MEMRRRSCHPVLVITVLAAAAVLPVVPSVTAAATPAPSASSDPAPADRGVIREEFPIFSHPESRTGSRTRGLHMVPPPLEEVVVYEDSLNALTIDNEGAWTHFDNSARPTAWNRTTFLGCQGTAWWCGVIDSTWIYDSNRAGYQNSWTQYLSNGVWLDSLPNNQTVRLGFRHRFDAETDYDYGRVEVLDFDDGWMPLAEFTGRVPNSGCDSVSVIIPDSTIAEFYANVDPAAHARFPFRFVFTSDIAYSSEDGLYDGDGWIIDNVTVRIGNNVRFHDDMESGPGLWDVSVFPPVGDYFAISSDVFTEDVCIENRTNVWIDYDPVTFSMVPRLDNLLHTPSVHVNRASEVFMAFDVYRNLPLMACFYYHLRYRTRDAGEDWSAWADPTRLVYYGATKDWARQKVVLPGAAGHDSIQVELAVTDYSAIYCDGVSSPGGVYTYFDNVAIGIVATAPPIILHRDVDLFQDTFQTTAFFQDDNINAPLGDSTVVEVSATRGYKSGFMFYRMNGGSWSSTPLLPAASALPRHRYADVPAGNYPANTVVEYYFAATDSTDATAYLPRGAITDGDYFSASVLPVKSATNPSLGCFDSLATILFVNNFSGRETRNRWLEALKAYGFKYDVWDVNAPSSGIGNTPGGSSAGDTYDWPAAGLSPLLQYSTILWHSGNLNQFTLSPQDQALLQSWIQQSGKSRNLWIAGDDVGNDLIVQGKEYNSFLSFTMGARYLRDLWESLPQDTLHPTIQGIAGGPASGRSFHADADCPLVDNFDLLNVHSSATTNGKAGVLLRYPNGFAAATRYATKYVTFGVDSARAVLMGFNVNAIEEAGERLQLVNTLISSYFNVAACYSPSAVEPEPGPGAPGVRDGMRQNAPNPFNPRTTIRYSVSAAGPVTIRIYGAGGTLVRTLVDGPHAAGEYDVRWDGTDDRGARLGSGVYFYRIETGTGFRDSKKLILLK